MTSTDCPICYETFSNDLFINCSNNHIACCYDCFSKLTDNKCPICRNPLGGGEVTTTTTTTTTTIRASIGSPRIRSNANNYDSNIANLINNHRRRLVINQREENEVIINSVFANDPTADTPANRTWARRSLAQSQRRRREREEQINQLRQQINILNQQPNRSIHELMRLENRIINLRSR